MEDKERVINWDFEGWPYKKLTLRNILNDIGLELINGKWQIDDSNPLLDTYPVRFTDDGMGYGVDKQWFVSAYSNLKEKPYCSFFTEPEVPNIELWREGQFHPYTEVKLVKDDTKLYVIDIRKNKDVFEYKCVTDFTKRCDKYIWYSENELKYS